MSFCYIGVGEDNQLYKATTLSGQWETVQAGDGGRVKSVAGMPDGRLVGVGTDNQLYTRATFTSWWVNVPESGDVIAVVALPDGTLVGIGPTHLLFTRATMTSPWVGMSGSVFGATTLPDGSFVGIGITNPGAAPVFYDLYTRPTVGAPWVQRPKEVINVPYLSVLRGMVWIAALPNGTFAGVGVDTQGRQHTLIRASADAPWQFISFGNLRVTAVLLGQFDGNCSIRRAVMDNGRILLDLKSVSGTYEFDWNWFVAPPAHSREVLAIALAAINSKKHVNISVKAVDPYVEVRWFGISD